MGQISVEIPQPTGSLLSGNQQAALAAQIRTDAELARLENAYAQMKDAGRDHDVLIAADLRFHLEILSATHNPFIGAFNTLLSSVMQRTLLIGWEGVESASLKAARLLQHQDVLDAIRRKSPEMAKMRMEILVDDSFKDIMKGLEIAAEIRKVSGL